MSSAEKQALLAGTKPFAGPDIEWYKKVVKRPEPDNGDPDPLLAMDTAHESLGIPDPRHAVEQHTSPTLTPRPLSSLDSATHSPEDPPRRRASS